MVTAQMLTLGGRKFVLLPVKDYLSLRRRGTGKPASRTKAQSAQDRADITLATKRLADPEEKPIPYEQVRKELGLT